MMNQGSESMTILDPNSMKGADVNQIHHSWSSSTGPVTDAGNSYSKNDAPCENTTLVNHSHQYSTQNPTMAAQSGVSSVSQASTSSNYTAPNVSQQYANYPSYPPSTEPYSYTNTQNQSYYNYQQPSVTDPSSQQAGNIQNSATPYQPYQNSGAYAAPQSYSNIGYSSGDHQTSTYANQNSYWNGGNYGSYPQQYSTYPSTVDNSNQVTSYTASNSIHYPQYNQWSYYYPPAPNVSCAPGTENTQATSGTPTYPVPAGGIYSYPTNQPPPPGTTSWRNESIPSESSFLQDKNNATQYNPYKYSAVAAPAPASQTPQINQMPLYYQPPANPLPTPPIKYENQQMNMQTVPPTSQSTSASHAPQNFQQPEPAQLLETNRVSKIQIPTNPKIATNLATGIPKEDKNRSMTNATSKPAYIGIQVPTPSNEVSSHDDTGATKVSLPPSFRTYVERTFARCKDDSQRAANQKHLKEVITKGSADGTLFTKNWDIEPLFPLLNFMIDEASQNVQTPVKIQIRRTKSRWEPMTEDKFAEKLAAANYDMTKSAVKMDDSKQTGSNDIVWNGLKSPSTQQQTSSNEIAYRPEKKPRFNANINVTENGEASNGSGKEQGLTKYYSSASALADSPEEKKRREHRSKRFERAQQSEIKPYRPKIYENKFTRMSRGTPLVKSFEVNESRAVEDIDWDALTVRGTCQEVEKRYLRLTSAPDPATVRPEEILEQALLMVQASQKNYLYKCDQLKSIRQDLTVQRIHNELTVKVYETHARLALEAGDLPEYNQCQSQLKSLYAEGINGCQTEFSAYNMLCITLHSNNKRDLLSAMTRLSIEAKKDDAVKHAFAVRSAVSSGNYIRFFRLYKSAPNLNTSLMDLYVEKMRYNAIKCICKSYRPTIPVSYISHNLGFSCESQAMDGEDKDSSGLIDCEEWLKAHGAVLITDNTGELQVDTKATGPCLYMPEPDDAVAHGDANLAVNDFLTRATS